jgi:hypothetical protein
MEKMKEKGTQGTFIEPKDKKKKGENGGSLVFFFSFFCTVFVFYLSLSLRLPFQHLHHLPAKPSLPRFQWTRSGKVLFDRGRLAIEVDGRLVALIQTAMEVGQKRSHLVMNGHRGLPAFKTDGIAQARKQTVHLLESPLHSDPHPVVVFIEAFLGFGQVLESGLLLHNVFKGRNAWSKTQELTSMLDTTYFSAQSLNKKNKIHKRDKMK